MFSTHETNQESSLKEELLLAPMLTKQGQTNKYDLTESLPGRPSVLGIVPTTTIIPTHIT